MTSSSPVITNTALIWALAPAFQFLLPTMRRRRSSPLRLEPGEGTARLGYSEVVVILTKLSELCMDS